VFDVVRHVDGESLLDRLNGERQTATRPHRAHGPAPDVRRDTAGVLVPRAVSIN
jgi:hypothetical protein